MSRRKTLQVTRTSGKAHGKKPTDPLLALWDDLLSGEPERVKSAYASLEAPERQAVLAHLERMVSGPGWLPEQRASAQAALNALKDQAH